MPRMLNLTGMRFGRLLALEINGQDKFRAYHWRCQCDCGSSVVVMGSALKRGVTNSCGCLRREKASQPRTHGMTHSPLYFRWRGMRERTGNPNNSEYRNYGGRGIRVCERWSSFENFHADMADGFEDVLELERIDVNGHYSPENCRWATHKEQQRNRRNNHVVTWKGKKLTVQEWGELLEIKPNTLIYRLRRGWSVTRALTKNANRNVLQELANGYAR